MMSKVLFLVLVSVVATFAYDCSVCYGDMCCNIPANHEYYLTDFCGSGGTTACGYSCTAYRYFTADRQRFGCNTYLQLCGRGKCVKAKVTDAGPADWVERDAGMPIIDSSVPTCQYFTGSSSCGWSDRILITAVPTMVGDDSELGPMNITREQYEQMVGPNQLAYDRMMEEQEKEANKPKAPAPCCSPNQWEGYQFSFDERTHFRAGLNISYDYTNKRFRILIEEHVGEARNRVLETIALFDKKTLYIKDYTANTCTTRPLTESMEQDCVPSTAVWEYSPVIGGSLKTNVFRFNTTVDNQRVYTTEVRTQDNCFPVDTFLADERYGVDVNFFWDITPGIKDPSIFNPPANCNGGALDHPLIPTLMKTARNIANAKF